MSTAEQSRSPPDLDAIARDLAALKRDLATLMDHLKGATVGSATDAAEQLGVKAQDLYAQASAQVEKGAKVLTQELEERPLTAILIAFSVGFIASRLLSR